MYDKLFERLSRLPVNQITQAVAKDFVNGDTPIITSEVASGKTMLLPAYCAEQLSAHGMDGVLYVLMPTRFLANNAVDSLWEILGEEGEELIGCLNGNRTDDESRVHENNQIIFTTVGYALASGIVRKENNFVLDEAHEMSIDLSLVKAILHRRIRHGEDIRLAIMSGTLNDKNEKSYWGKLSNVYTTKGSAHPIEILERPASSLDGCVLDLIQNHDRKGILVFVEGQSEIAQAYQDIQSTLRMWNIHAEIDTIWGGSSGLERRRASAMPVDGGIKILIGTNVLESGISLPWVDGGVSTGAGKVLHVTDGVRRLITEALPRWRIIQQSGRTRRFRPGVFVLNSQAPLASRPEMQIPDIKRLPLTELVLHCARYDIPLNDLQFSDIEQPAPNKIREAIQELTDYGFVYEKEELLHLTEDGKLISDFPGSFQAAAAYCEAIHNNIVAEALPLIAALEVRDIRKDFRNPLGGSVGSSGVMPSDLIAIVLAVLDVEKAVAPLRDNRSRSHEFATRNISFKRYREFKNILESLESSLEIQSNMGYWNLYDPNHPHDTSRALMAVLFRAFITQLFPNSWGSMKIDKEINGRPFLRASISKTSSTFLNGDLASGNLRLITPRGKDPFMVVETVTSYSDEDLDCAVERWGLGFVMTKCPNYEIREVREERARINEEREREMQAERAARQAELETHRRRGGEGINLFGGGEELSPLALAMAKARAGK